jgi:peroxiredoxin
MPLQTGQKAPGFTLPDSDKKNVSLSDQQGKNVVLLFFPLAFTSVCTAELCHVRDNFQQFEQLNATVFGISADSPPTLAIFKGQQNLNFSLLSDFNKEAATAYESIYENFAWGLKGVPKRAAFVIDQEGIIRYAEVLEDAGKQPDFDAIQKTLEQL